MVVVVVVVVVAVVVRSPRAGFGPDDERFIPKTKSD